jgi:hypothetical protein
VRHDPPRAAAELCGVLCYACAAEFSAVLYVLCCGALCRAVLRCEALCRIVMCCSAELSAASHNAPGWSSMLCRDELRCAMLCGALLCCPMLCGALLCCALLSATTLPGRCVHWGFVGVRCDAVLYCDTGGEGDSLCYPCGHPEPICTTLTELSYVTGPLQVWLGAVSCWSWYWIPHLPHPH